MGQQRRTLATLLFAATKKRLASYITCCWHYTMKVVIASLNRPKQDKSVGKEMPISRIVIAVPNTTVVLLD
jgi:hypothetical protein